MMIAVLDVCLYHSLNLNTLEFWRTNSISGIAMGGIDDLDRGLESRVLTTGYPLSHLRKLSNRLDLKHVISS